MLFERKNFLLMLLGLGLISLGFLTMSGGGSDDPKVFNPAIFNFQRISLAPALVLLGFATEVVAILYNDKQKEN
mgnify:FL=1